MRVSDQDRERVVEVLRRHTAEGRLTLEEFEDRLDETMAVRTYGEIESPLRELPVTVPEPARPQAATAGARRCRPHAARRSGPGRLPQFPFPAVLAVVAVVATLIFAAGGPGWVVWALPWWLLAHKGGHRQPRLGGHGSGGQGSGNQGRHQPMAA